jgi:hypothetical protein
MPDANPGRPGAAGSGLGRGSGPERPGAARGAHGSAGGKRAAWGWWPWAAIGLRVRLRRRLAGLLDAEVRSHDEQGRDIVDRGCSSLGADYQIVAMLGRSPSWPR